MKINRFPKSEDYRKFAIALAKKSGALLYRNFGKIKKIEEKGFKDYVTDIDKKSEKIIIRAIKKRFPGHDILAEEKGRIGKKSDYLWLVDPLDGTHNYIARIPLYGVSLALTFKRGIVLGVIYLPHLKDIYWAEIGKGAYLNGKRIKVSNKSLEKSPIFFDSAFQNKRIEKIRDLEAVSRKAGKVRIFGCLSSQLVCVADGKAGGVVAQTGKPWDYAAGSLIIQEAGGKVTNFRGEKLVVGDQYMLATNGKIHNQLIKLLKRNK